MDKFGLLGGKLGHSLSPAIHKLFFKYTDKEGTYDLLETEVEKISSRMEELRKNFKGANVTIPHKLHVMPFLDGISEEAKAIGAVNTIKFTPEGAFGYNTDYFGFARMLEYNKIFAKGKACAVLGTGGAARAVVKYLAAAAASKIGIYPEVRKQLVAAQQEIAKGINCVMEGRDTTSVVLPNATLKVYLDADVPVRAKRR